MRLAIGGFAHETVTFLPDETGLADFEAATLRGSAIIDTLRGTNTDAGGMIGACERAGAEVLGLVHAVPLPSGPVTDAVFDTYLDETIACIRAAEPLDGLLLHLHGAMATPTRQDPEGDFLRGLRGAVGPDLPIALSMDLHGNIAPAMMQYAQIVCGYHESPHIDMGRTGERAAELLIRSIRGEIDPVMAISKPGIVLPSIFTATSLSPLCDLMAEARRREGEPGILDTTIFTGFAYSDVDCIGMAAVVVANGDHALAQSVADDLSKTAARLRDRLYKRELLLSADEAIARTHEIVSERHRPVVLLEHADRLSDSTYTLRALLRDGRLRSAVPYLHDPAAVDVCVKAGVGAEVTLTVGGRSSDRAGGPVEIAGVVRFAGPKRYIITGPCRHGAPVDLGAAAVVETDNVTLILTTNMTMALDEDPFRQFDLEVRDFDAVVLRSKTHFRAVWQELATEILIVETPDWGPADLSTLPYKNVPPGIFPVTA